MRRSGERTEEGTMEEGRREERRDGGPLRDGKRKKEGRGQGGGWEGVYAMKYKPYRYQVLRSTVQNGDVLLKFSRWKNILTS